MSEKLSELKIKDDTMKTHLIFLLGILGFIFEANLFAGTPEETIENEVINRVIQALSDDDNFGFSVASREHASLWQSGQFVIKFNTKTGFQGESFCKIYDVSLWGPSFNYDKRELFYQTGVRPYCETKVNNVTKKVYPNVPKFDLFVVAGTVPAEFSGTIDQMSEYFRPNLLTLQGFSVESRGLNKASIPRQSYESFVKNKLFYIINQFSKFKVIDDTLVLNYPDLYLWNIGKKYFSCRDSNSDFCEDNSYAEEIYQHNLAITKSWDVHFNLLRNEQVYSVNCYLSAQPILYSKNLSEGPDLAFAAKFDLFDCTLKNNSTGEVVYQDLSHFLQTLSIFASKNWPLNSLQIEINESPQDIIDQLIEQKERSIICEQLGGCDKNMQY